MSSAIPSSVNELVQFITTFVAEEAARTGRSVTGAKIADKIYKTYPSFSYAQLGLERLRDVIRVGEREGLLHRIRGIMHLEVAPGVESVSSAASNLESHDGLQYVRPEIWNALTFFQRNVLFFFDRQSARVIEIGATDKGHIEALEGDSIRYIKLEMIPGQTQQQWMRNYLQSASIPNANNAPIDSPTWWSAFPEWLARNGAPEQYAGWRVFRVQAIISYVREWAKEKNVPITAVLSSTNPYLAPQRRSSAPVPVIIPKREPAEIEKSKSDEELTRAAILRSIAELSTEELVKISVSFDRVLRHFKPR